MDKIGVIGCGYVGLVTGVCLAELGNQVLCSEVDGEKVEKLSLGVSPIYEPDLQPLLAKNLSLRKVEFTTDFNRVIREASILFVAVGTPTTTIGTTDLSQVNGAVDRILSMATGEKIVVMKSTVPVGTGSKLSRLFSRKRSANISYLSNPEFLREGQAVRDFMTPDRIVIGGDVPELIERIASFFEPLKAPCIRTTSTNAELIKYASNAFLATKISFINEIANLCEEVGADVSVVAEGMGLDPRINNHFMRAGIGYGGSCFPKDVKALKQLAGHNGYHFELLSAVIEVNEMQKMRPIQKLRRHLGRLYGRRIGVLGLTFKPNTDDVRDSVGVDLAKLLLFEGAHVTAFDPLGLEQARKVLTGVDLIEDPYLVAEGAEALVIATEDPLYAGLDWERIRGLMAKPLVVDGRNTLDPADLPDGFILEQVGRRVKRIISECGEVGVAQVGLGTTRRVS
ncbi:MAG: UDP-glucose/GDP-mannose dehydrogenase family protein [Actinobacteria bacterium]|nr:UDP-glucose/GDP-mannose dehydrogenase family protein [Actinomycetota bacterium]